MIISRCIHVAANSILFYGWVRYSSVCMYTHIHIHTHIPPKGQEKWYDPDGKFIHIEVELLWPRLRRKMATFQMSDPVPSTVKAFSNTTSLTSNKCSWITLLDTAWEIFQVCFYYGKWMMRKYSELHVYFLKCISMLLCQKWKIKIKIYVGPQVHLLNLLCNLLLVASKVDTISVLSQST